MPSEPQSQESDHIRQFGPILQAGGQGFEPLSSTVSPDAGITLASAWTAAHRTLWLGGSPRLRGVGP